MKRLLLAPHCLHVAPCRSTPAVLRSSSRFFSSTTGDDTLPPYRVLFFGTDDVSLATLRKLHANSQESDPAKRLVGEIHVICPTDRKVGGGRGQRIEPVPVKKFALENGLGVTHTPPQAKSLKKWQPEVVQNELFDVGVVVSFGYFLHPHLLHNLTHGAINMHPSLLPKYRGPAPIHHALLNGDTVTGASVIEIDPRAFDVGRILLQKPFEIPNEVTAAPLAQQLAEFGANCVLETLASLPKRKANALTQDDALATHAPKIHALDGFLTLQETADEIFYRWQALSDNVGVCVRFMGKDVKLVELRRPTEQDLQDLMQQQEQLSTGAFFYEKKRQAMWLRCANGSWLLVTKLQQADRKIGGAIDFANGFRLKPRAVQQFEPITIRSQGEEKK